MSEYQGKLDGSNNRFALLVSRFNSLVTERLLDGARACLVQHGVSEADIHIVWVPGAWELPQAAKQLRDRGDYAAIVALGCVIRGETPHFDYVAGAAANGLATVALEGSVPIAFGVITTENADQALARAGGKSGNKGWEAALSALEMASLFRRLEEELGGS
ncbi:MAG TPA: 6,7-dimethyl-8-ribityllumazine synthase [Longimicrobiales bacterium]|nr:6,7-dimethyl-8-ribityllumazine synthase [Longimicrobiales bacterium]